MKIEIELTDEQAACLWDDVTWSGRSLKTIQTIVQDEITARASKSVEFFGGKAGPALIAKFKAAHAAPAEPQNLTNHQA